MENLIATEFRELLSALTDGASDCWAAIILPRPSPVAAWSDLYVQDAD